jgi:hypothetical protein
MKDEVFEQKNKLLSKFCDEEVLQEFKSKSISVGKEVNDVSRLLSQIFQIHR